MKKKIITKTPTLGDLALAKLSLEDSKVKTLAKGREGNRNASVFTSTGLESTESSQDLCVGVDKMAVQAYFAQTQT